MPKQAPGGPGGLGSGGLGVLGPPDRVVRYVHWSSAREQFGLFAQNRFWVQNWTQNQTQNQIKKWVIYDPLFAHPFLDLGSPPPRGDSLVQIPGQKPTILVQKGPGLEVPESTVQKWSFGGPKTAPKLTSKLTQNRTSF